MTCIRVFCVCVRVCACRLTTEDSAGHSGDSLDRGHVVGSIVSITGGVEERRITEHLPELSGDGAVSHLHRLGTHIKVLPHQSPVPQDTHTGEGRG